MVNILIDICNILGVYYDSDYLLTLDDECLKVEYLLNQIYIYLGGSNNA